MKGMAAGVGLIAVLMAPTVLAQRSGNDNAPRAGALSAPSDDARLDRLELRIKDLDARVAALQAENAALKEQAVNQKTSIKAIDMTVTDIRSTYANHVHYLGRVGIGGFVPIRPDGGAAPVNVLIPASTKPSNQYTGKPVNPDE